MPAPGRGSKRWFAPCIEDRLSKSHDVSRFYPDAFGLPAKRIEQRANRVRKLDDFLVRRELDWTFDGGRAYASPASKP